MSDLTDSSTRDPLDDEALVADLRQHLVARAELLDLTDGSEDDVVRRAGVRRRRIAGGRAAAACAVAASVVVGAVFITNPGSDDPRHAIDTAGPPSLVGDPGELVLTPLDPTGFSDVVYDLAAADGGFYAVDFGPLASEPTADDAAVPRVLWSDDGSSWTDVLLPLEAGDRPSRVVANGSTAVVLGEPLQTAPGVTPLGAVAFVGSRVEGWDRVAVAGATGLDAGVLPDGTVLVSAYTASSQELASQRASERLSAELTRRFPDHDGYGWSYDGEPSAESLRATEVEVTKGGEVLGTVSFAELGLDPADLDALASQGGEDSSGSSALYRVEGDGLVPLELPTAPDPNGYVNFAGDTVVVQDGLGGADWMLADGTWADTPAAFGSDQIVMLRSTPLGTFAAVQGASSRLFRGDSMAGPWEQVDLGPLPDNGFGMLSASGGEVFYAVQDYGPSGMAESAPPLTAPSPQEEIQVVLEVDGLTVELDFVEGGARVLDPAGNVVVDIAPAELTDGSDRVQIAEDGAILTLPDGQILRLDAMQVRAAFEEQYGDIAGSHGEASVSVEAAQEVPIGQPSVTVYSTTDGRSFRARTSEVGFSQVIAGPVSLVQLPTDDGTGLVLHRVER